MGLVMCQHIGHDCDSSNEEGCEPSVGRPLRL